jgi:hypothetical protein
MRYLFFLFWIFCFFIGSLHSAEKLPFEQWPQIKMEFGRVLIAKGALANQGFGGAKEKDFTKTVMFFPDMEEGTTFVNIDQGYGPVIKDLDVISLDKDWNVLKISPMKKKTGTVVVPAKTCFVFECVPQMTKKLKFKAGKPSPIAHLSY